MKSFFALATAFALGTVRFAAADVVPPRFSMQFFSAFAPSRLVLGVPHHGIHYPPPPNTPLVIADTSADGYLYNTFFLTVSTDRGFGQIQYGPPGLAGLFCVTGHGADGTPPTVETCRENDPEQLWEVHGYGLTTVSNKNKECITVTSPNPQPGDKLSVTPCQDPLKKEQLWNAKVEQ